QDGRTNPLAIYGDPAIDGQAEIWQGFMDLPPGPCTIELRARDGDGEVICTAQEPFSIAADSTTKVNIVLICDISFQAPVGMLDVDGTFSFNVGNFCPDLFILNCLNSMPAEQQVLPPPNPPLAGTGCQVRFRDGDSTCGQGCDPQSCSPNGLTGLTCTPGPDPGVSTTVTCDADTLLDCQGDGVPDPSCTFTGDTEGTLGQQPPAFPGLPGDGGFFITCLPPALGGTPGSTATCTAVTTDGDLDCDKTKVVDVACPGLTPCDQYAADGFVCDDGTVCTTDTCNDALAVGGTCGSADNGPCCVTTNLPDGTDCSAEPGGGECLAGLCLPLDCTSNLQCDDGNGCTFDLCNLGTGICTNTQLGPGTPCVDPASCPGVPGQCNAAGSCTFSGCTSDAECVQDSNECTINPAGSCDLLCGTCSPEINAPAGTPCASGTGLCDGAGVCIDPCLGVDCSDGNDCTQDVCDPGTNPGTCSNPPESSGTVCDFGGGLGGGSCDGAGTCVDALCISTVTGSTVTACRASFNQSVSNFFVDMTVTPNACITAGAPFTVDITPTIIADLDFLNVAASTLCNLGFTLTEADLSLVQVQVDAVAGAFCTPQLSELSPVPQTVTLDADFTGICGSGGTVIVNTPISVALPPVTLSCFAGSAPGPVALCATGTLPFNVFLGSPPVDTWVTLAAGPIGVEFACGEAKVTQSTPCVSDLDCVPGSSCLFDGTCSNIVVPLDPLTDCLLLPVQP
ncbi:MAG: hypothetical protein OER77_01840, partial [Myxococcales bacterium]|nr:hypothetical protein [Myxococcales bacterium]